MIRSFEDLNVWKKSHQFTLMIYESTGLFPKEERFGLISQLRRASVSIEANIAEGNGRRTTKSYIAFLNIAFGSLQECQALCRISYDLGFLEVDRYKALSDLLISIKMMLNKLISSLSRKLK